MGNISADAHETNRVCGFFSTPATGMDDMIAIKWTGIKNIAKVKQ